MRAGESQIPASWAPQGWRTRDYARTRIPKRMSRPIATVHRYILEAAGNSRATREGRKGEKRGVREALLPRTAQRGLSINCCSRALSGEEIINKRLKKAGRDRRRRQIRRKIRLLTVAQKGASPFYKTASLDGRLTVESGGGIEGQSRPRKAERRRERGSAWDRTLIINCTVDATATPSAGSRLEGNHVPESKKTGWSARKGLAEQRGTDQGKLTQGGSRSGPFSSVCAYPL